jgi:choline dehydrogenase-like flavoprotein
MIISSQDASNDMASDAAVCIVGSGAAGITLACEFDRCNFKVLLLEAGDRSAAVQTPDFYAGKATAPHPPANEFRRVGFGGTTSIWGGRCVPFDPIDFERREYLANSGWPISYQEVAKHYPRALQYCDAGEFEFTASASIKDAAATISDLTENRVIDGDLIERYSLPTDFGKRYRRKLSESKNVIAVLGARCVRLHRLPGQDRVSGVEIALQSGERRTLAPKITIVAAGGIESTRLLLASDPNAQGIGNSFDLLGRFYGCHIQGTFARLVPNGTAVVFDFERARDGAYCRRKLQFSPDAQRQHRLRNTAFRLHFPEYSDASHGSAAMSAIYLAKSLLISEYQTILQQKGQLAVMSPKREHLRNILFGIPQLLRFSTDWLFRRQLAERKLPYTLIANKDGSYPLEFNCEQTPLESSRITLLNDLDAQGVRRVNIDWRRTDEDIAAVERGFRLLRDTLSRSSKCRVEFDDELARRRLEVSDPTGGHHLGTIRMAASARLGVVDANCAVFDCPNLYVASSAVFPTGSHANPTLTIVALALRMAEHLKGKLGHVG